MKWQITSEGPNQMPEASQSEQKSYEKIREQTFSTKFVENGQRFREFCPFYLEFEIVDPLHNATQGSLISPLNVEEGPESISLGFVFMLKAFSGSKPALAGISWLLFVESILLHYIQHTDLVVFSCRWYGAQVV